MSSRAIIYVRQSLDRDGNELGVERQVRECKRLCKERGYEVGRIITDNNRSASVGNRPGYQELLRLIAAGKVDAVVVLRIDRLLRKLTELETFIELGIPVATVEGDIDLSTPSGRLVGRLLASVARAEVEVKSERHKLANEQKARAGKPHGSRRPYGYEADLVTVRESEATVLREMASRVLAGHSYKEIAYWLNKVGHKTTMGKLWYPITVRNMLGKERYAGIRVYRGASYPAVWEPIFDAPTWERLQLTMRLRREAHGSSPVARKYLLTGLVFCGGCGMPLNGAQKRDRPERPVRRTYFCRVTGDTKRERGCGGVVRNADALEDWIVRCILYRLDSPDVLSLLGNGSDDGELRELLTNKQAASQRLDVLVDDYATGLLNREQFARAKSAAEAELQRLEEKLASIGSRASLPSHGSIEDAWNNSESDEWRRQILRLLIKKIDVLPGITKPFYETRDGRRMRFDPSLIDVSWIA